MRLILDILPCRLRAGVRRFLRLRRLHRLIPTIGSPPGTVAALRYNLAFEFFRWSAFPNKKGEAMATLMLFGHGASVSGTTFDFRRSAPTASRIYFWAAESRPSKVYDEVMNSIIANTGAIPIGWAQERASRIGGTLVTDHELHDPTQPAASNLVPWLPANFGTLANQTNIAALNGTAYHNNATLTGSTVMVFRVSDGGQPVRLSAILSNANFNNRALNIAWLVCRT